MVHYRVRRTSEQIQNGTELYHHGILGQKWGVRRFQNADGTRTEEGKKRDRVLKAGTEVYRIDMNPDAPVYDNKRYVSTSKKDNAKWEQYLGRGYGLRGKAVYSIAYKTTEDIKVADTTTVGKLFVEEFLSKSDNVAINDTFAAAQKLYGKSPDSINIKEAPSLNFAAQTETGKQIINRLLEMGYGAAEDMHGRNVSKDPVIIFAPESKMERTSVKKVNKYVR